MPAGRPAKPVEQKKLLGNPGGRPLPKAELHLKLDGSNQFDRWTLAVNSYGTRCSSTANFGLAHAPTFTYCK
jgi:hypothetical protein